MLRAAKSYIFLVIMAVCTLSSCDKSMFDSEGDCDVSHIIRFRYEQNLKWADAFPSEVNSVNLYVFDKNGVFVKEYKGRGDALSSPDYYIELDLPVGKYTFVAWCGLENNGEEMESFTVPQPVAGVTTIEQLTCTLNTIREETRTASEDGLLVSSKKLYFLYHGQLDVNIEDHHDGRRYEHTMYLTKDTNHLRIILQELNSDIDMNAEDYDFKIEDTNGMMAYNNDLCSDAIVTYTPWDKQADVVGVGRIEIGNEVRYAKGVVVDFSVSRMMASHSEDMWLTITNHESGETIAHIPLIQYALLSRHYYESAYGHAMSDQEFLDREDEYIYTFFLYNNKWRDSYIDILQWRIVLGNYGLE